MRRSVRSVLVALLAVLALGAVAASGASAFNFQIEGKSLTGTEAITGVYKATTWERVALNLSGSKIIFECKKSPATGSLEGNAGLNMTMALEECALIEPSKNCKLPAAEEKRIMLYADGSMESLTQILNRGAGAGGEIVSFGIEDREGLLCGVSGNFSVTGYWQCYFPEGNEEKFEHEEICQKGQSFLKWGTETGTMSYTEMIKLASGKRWRVVE